MSESQLNTPRYPELVNSNFQCLYAYCPSCGEEIGLYDERCEYCNQLIEWEVME